MKRRWMVVATLVSACSRSPAAAPAVVSAPAEPELWAGDALFAEGRCGEAVAAYSAALEETTTRDATARLRLFRALARLECASTQSTEQAFGELRALERDYPTLVWGRLARLFIDELVREQALQQTLSRAEAELARLDEQIERLEQDVRTARADATDHKALLATLRSERRTLQDAYEQATEKATAAQRRVEQLEAELAALKRIDMAREP
jgi:chromosome segregation ATPase